MIIKNLTPRLLPDSDWQKNRYCVPRISPWSISQFTKHFGGKPCQDDFKYNSGTITEWLSVEDINALIKRHV